MMEHLVYDQQGQLLTGSLADYLIPTASDFPNIRAIVLENSPSPINPLGAKGAGEGGIIAAGGIMANAVANALSTFDVQPRELPLTPTRIWELVQAASSAIALSHVTLRCPGVFAGPRRANETPSELCAAQSFEARQDWVRSRLRIDRDTRALNRRSR